MSNTTKSANLHWGADVTDRFFIWNGKVPSILAEQANDDAARILIHTILDTDGIPCEGSMGEEHSLSFRQETTGLGYTMAYEVGAEDGLGFVHIHAVRVYRDERWDDETVDPDEGFEMQGGDELFDKRSLAEMRKMFTICCNNLAETLEDERQKVYKLQDELEQTKGELEQAKDKLADTRHDLGRRCATFAEMVSDKERRERELQAENERLRKVIAMLTGADNNKTI